MGNDKLKRALEELQNEDIKFALENEHNNDNNTADNLKMARYLRGVRRKIKTNIAMEKWRKVAHAACLLLGVCFIVSLFKTDKAGKVKRQQS